MNLLDRYIARQYLINLVILLLVLAGFLILVDTAYNLDRFHKRATEWAARDNLSASSLNTAWLTVRIILDLWWPRLLYLFSFMLGAILIVGMGFTVSQMVRHRELVALLASGQSLHRIARPIFLVALLLTGVSLINTELLLPQVAPKLARDTHMAGRETLAERRLPLSVDAQGRVFYAAAFSPEAATLENVLIIERDPESHLVRREIAARRATWHDGGWDLEGVTLGPGAPGAATEPPTRIETTLDPLAMKMRLYQAFASTISMRQAWWAAEQSRRLGGDDPAAMAAADNMVRTALSRPVGMITNLLVLTISLCFFLTREPVNMFWQSLKCAPIGLGGLIGGSLTKASVIPGLPAWAAVVAPVAILLPLAIAMWHRVRT